MRLQEGDEIRWASRASATTQPIITKREKNKRGIYGNVRFEKTKNWGLELLIDTYIIASSSNRRLVRCFRNRASFDERKEENGNFYASLFGLLSLSPCQEI